MYRSTGEKNQSQATTPDLDDSISFSDDVNPDVDVDVESVPTNKPHFLDYDAVPPPDFVEHFDRAMNFGNSTTSQSSNVISSSGCGGGSGEQLKLDKKYERDGEISDYELAASGYTKKEFTQDDNTLNIISTANAAKPRKHFLDENPIPPDYMLSDHQLREHRSLDRNFERHNEQRSALDLHTNLPGFRSSRERFKEIPALARLPKGTAWTQSFDSRYDSNLSADKLDDFGPKVECVYSLLSMLGSNDPLEMSKKFHELSKTPETCNTLRRSGCIPLLVQMIHADGGPDEQRKWAGMALHNVVHTHPDEKSGRREAKVLRLLDQIMDYCNFLRTLLQSGGEAIADDADRHPLAAMSSLMKVSFDEEHRHAMCELGALQAIPSLVHLDHAVHGPKPENQCCNSLRRFALMALTNLTFGDENNKALLCSQKLFMEALVAQLDSAPDDLLQVTASVLRNLSWRADAQMKAVLNEIGTVTALAKAAMKNKCENTLKAILSALWNLSAHCSTNKAEFCAVEGALSFIVCMLTYEGPSKTLKIIENAGGILRNVSSHIAVREDYRQILREHNCLSILLQQLKSESLTVVSNSCGTLWNLSARCPEDQRFLWDNGAVPMLRSLIHSKHAMISEGSACALKNLLNFRPSSQNTNHIDNIARSLNLKKLPTLNVRKQKALEQELGAASKSHSETCDNLDSINPKDRPTYDASAAVGSSIQRHRFPIHNALGSVVGGAIANGATSRLTRSAMLTKSESRDSVFSAKSDGAVYDHLMRSHSASDANRKLHQNSRPPATTSYPLESDVEPVEEQPIDYSQKYKEHITKHSDHREDEENCPATYQETDLDQPTDFSLRYAENQLESDIDLSPPVGTEVNAIPTPSLVNMAVVTKQTKPRQDNATEGNEILLILEDSVKCYQTEDTPYVISNAASVTDLRSVPTSSKIEENDIPSGIDNSEATSTSGAAPIPTRKLSRINSHHQTTLHSTNPYGSGSYTPEKPVNYCEEGTPGYFSRYESLSSLDESPPQGENSQKEVRRVSSKTSEDIPSASKNTSDGDKCNSPPEPPPMVQTPQVNSALATPLMFSRRSSMDSLAEEDVGPLDDKSSVVSDFSRLASGVISPSEIPDSPTQSMPQSPRRNSGSGQATNACFSAGVSPNTQRIQSSRSGESSKRCLRSVFEDDLNTFNVENTPAQFSTATSLSNLSILDEESSNQSPPQQQQPNQPVTTNTISEGEEEEDANENNDDLLLASCINMGMNRAAIPSTYSQNTDTNSSVIHPTGMTHDEPRQYYTEDTPALLSKVGSNTNLSAISICSSNNDPKEDTVYEVLGRSSGNTNIIHHTQSINRRSLNLSDDMSSNASESGAGGIDILQQCIRDGMQKPSSTKDKADMPSHPMTNLMDPIAMLRRGGNLLPPFVPVNDEMNKYRVEDSPCNFSVMSGLSNLTVGSSLVGPAVILQGASNITSNNTDNSAPVNKISPPLPMPNASIRDEKAPKAAVPIEDARREPPQWHDDSLSSLSIESEDDTNLLSQAIAAGCNRPKSNLGFTTSMTSTGRHTTTSLSSSQPIAINTATSTSSLTSQATARNFEKHQQQNHSKHNYRDPLQAGNESYSSVDSSDSNDNQSKSLFELCILTGMHKNRESNMVGSSGGSTTSRKHTRSVQSHRSKSGHTEHNTTQSNPNLKQFDSLPMQGKQLTPNRHVRERDRRDEKLLMECINTGIMKKIGESNNKQSTTSLLTREALVLHNTQPKNGQATSAAVQMEEATHPISAKYITNNSNNCSITTANISTTITAAPDVEKKDKQHIIMVTETLNNMQQQQNSNITINLDEDIKDRKNLKTLFQRVEEEENQTPPLDVNLQNQENVPEIMNGIGYKHDIDNCDSIGNDGNTTQSDESNQSFIMDTTVSLESKNTDLKFTLNNCTEKHKDPDLMLKSVERLTLEFVSSAEQLRTYSNTTANVTQSLSLDSGENKKKINSLIIANHGGGTNNSTSNNTWNEDTCPNDVSFPSVSVTAPKVASLSYDDDDEEDQATTADYKELNDFAENTPINEELPTPDMSLDFDNIDIQSNGFYLNASQPVSLECLTETEQTLVNSKTNELNIDTVRESVQENSQGLHFKLGGIVQTAATTSSIFFSTNSMTNSTYMAQEARKLAANLHTSDLEEEEELTFSVNSLDLDNIRPPSGMDSLNISGYYQDATQPNSLQKLANSPHSPQMSFKSPKFPRKTLPAGLVARRALGHMPPHLTGSMESVNSSCNLLLDNIKPPSLMDELLDSMISVASIQSEIAEDCPSMATTVTLSNYETCAGGVEDGDTVTLQSCCDNLLPKDDDQTLYEGNTTPLPTDYEFSSADSTPKKSAATASPSSGGKRTLTPKQKRKMIKDRFKTYTIEADMIMREELQRKMDEAQQDETLAIEITNLEQDPQDNDAQNTPRNRRRSSQDRYKTQTIVYSDLQLQQTQLSSLESNNEDGMDISYSSIKNMTQQFKFITSNYVKPTDLTGSAAQIEECELTSLEYEQNSETESCHNFGNNLQSLTDNEEEENEAEHPAETSGPRIVKPGDKDSELINNKQDDLEVAATKIVRGGKKPQYISPYSIKYQKSNGVDPKQANTKLQTPSATNTNFLRKRHTNVAAATQASANTKMAQKKTIIKDAGKKIDNETTTTSSTPPAPLERQGTFVKDEPSLDSSAVPVVDTSPTKTKLSKLPTKRQNSTSAHTSPQKTANTRKLPTSSTIQTTINKRNLGSISKPQRANSNVNIRVTTNAARIAVLSNRVSTTTPPSRSNSSLNSSNAAMKAAKNAAAKINQAQSRIAGIWRKVDEAKKQPPSKILKGSQLKSVNPPPPQPGHLIRSTTFDNTPTLEVKPAKTTPQVNGTKLPAGGATKIAMAHRQTVGSRK